jgi:hypothetical protein
MQSLCLAPVRTSADRSLSMLIHMRYAAMMPPQIEQSGALNTRL